jgi:hypothetical protein
MSTNASALYTIAAAAAQEPADLPRLTAGNVFLAHARMGAALERLVTAYKAIPEATPLTCDTHLKEIIKMAEGIIKGAQRLLESNR